MYTNETRRRIEMTEKKPTISERMQKVRAARAEAKAIRERERAERNRLKNRKTEAQIRVREQKGGAGMQILFFDKAPPLSFSRRRKR
jgi:hypothetical protein